MKPTSPRPIEAARRSVIARRAASIRIVGVSLLAAAVALGWPAAGEATGAVRMVLRSDSGSELGSPLVKCGRERPRSERRHGATPPRRQAWCAATLQLLCGRECYSSITSMRTELVTTLKRKATDILAEVARQREPVLITEHGRPAAYLVDVASYERLTRRLAVLEAIARGERAVQEGRVVSHTEAKKRMARWLS